MHQGNIIIPPITEEEALVRAHVFLREKYGTIPSSGSPVFEKGVYKIPIEVKYPRVIMDKITNRPRKVRYMNFKENSEKPGLGFYLSTVNEKYGWIRGVFSRATVCKCCGIRRQAGRD
jgi:hypothetical protein